jgi:predicted phage terminase large subunit-like protein
MTPNLLHSLLILHDESVLRETIRANLIDWATDVMMPSGLALSAHHRFLLSHLDLIVKGDVKRLIVLMPPGSAKSTYVSVVFPVWWFLQYPRSSVIAVSHTAELAEHFSRRVQALIKEHRSRIGFDLRADDRSASHWETTAGGQYYAVGIRGAITGRRADLVIIDDPIKSMGEAESQKHRQYIWDWYATELTTRLKPDARVVIVMTRWHEQDLGGQLIANNPDDWHVLRLPAIAENNDPIGRPVGSPLWPGWESLEALKQKQATLGKRAWSALFQQTPRPPTERLFDVGMLQQVEQRTEIESSARKTVRAWDLAATTPSGHDNPDWTVGLKLTLEQSGRYVIEDVVRLRGNYRLVQETILATARLDGHATVISLPIDPGQAGKSQIAQLSSLLAGFRIYTSQERGSKVSRASLAATQINAANFGIRQGSWNQAFNDELSSFPQGTKDDQVDALSRAFITLADFPTSGRRIFVPYNIR